MPANRRKLSIAPAQPAMPRGLARLRGIADRLVFEPHDIAANLNDQGRYEVAFEREFPLHIKLFHYTSQRHTRGATWHERLELFTPLDGPARFRMGNKDVLLQRGDILVVDNLKLHHVVDFPGFDTRVIVISFLPEFDHISRHHANRLSVTEAAAMVHMSQPQFMKVFKKVAGTTLVAYLNHVRLSNSLRLLRETSGSIAEVATQTGFSDQSYFDRRFKAAFGMSPRRYRETLAQGDGLRPLRLDTGN